MHADMAEALRRKKLAEDFVAAHPHRFGSGVKKSQLWAFLNGYDQACRDLLSPKETPGQPATAISLLNRIGEMVLRNRKEVLAIPFNERLQCPGCFCMLEDQQKGQGWCANCYKHMDRLIAQVDEGLPQT